MVVQYMNNLHKITSVHLTDEEMSVLYWAFVFNKMYKKREFKIIDNKLYWNGSKVQRSWALDVTMKRWINDGRPKITYEQLT